MRFYGKWLEAAFVSMIIASCSSSAPTTTTVSSPLATVETASSEPVETTTSQVTTTAPTTIRTADGTTTTVESPVVITRPFVDPAVCGSGGVSAFRSQDVTIYPFAVGREQPIPLQVLAQRSDGVAMPFAVVLRFSADRRDLSEDHPVLINGVKVGITVFANGNGAAAWTLPDGTKAYMRARGLDEAAIVGLVTRLTPRDLGAAVPGFDLQPSIEPNALVLLHEHLNTGLSGVVTTFQCVADVNQSIYRIRTLAGDPVWVYFGIIDAPPPYAVGVNGDGAITITGPANRTVALQQVTNADDATWAALPTIQQP
jgi:hypothetical protein